MWAILLLFITFSILVGWRNYTLSRDTMAIQNHYLLFVREHKLDSLLKKEEIFFTRLRLVKKERLAPRSTSYQWVMVAIMLAPKDIELKSMTCTKHGFTISGKSASESSLLTYQKEMKGMIKGCEFSEKRQQNTTEGGMDFTIQGTCGTVVS